MSIEKGDQSLNLIEEKALKILEKYRKPSQSPERQTDILDVFLKEKCGGDVRVFR